MEQILLEEIKHENTTYILSEPLELRLIKRKKKPLITAVSGNPIFTSIIGYGTTREASLESFCEEFDYSYSRYNQLVDSLLSNNVINIKKELNRIVKEVKTQQQQEV